jgi:hypothetical protein
MRKIATMDTHFVLMPTCVSIAVDTSGAGKNSVAWERRKFGTDGIDNTVSKFICFACVSVAAGTCLPLLGNGVNTSIRKGHSAN